jgi:hypothetical protein
VLGQNNQNLAKVCEAMAFALGTPAASAQTQEKMTGFLAQIKSLPAEQLASLVSAVDASVQIKLQQALA